MPEKISVYIDKKLHRLLKAEASLRGKSLSEYMVDAAVNALHAPQRQAAASKMDRIRESVKGSFTVEDLHDMRDEGKL